MEAQISDMARSAGQVLMNPALIAVAAAGWLALVTGFAARVAETVESHSVPRPNRSAHRYSKERNNMESSTSLNRDAAATGNRSAMDQENTMKAIVQDKFGSADVLELRQIDKPDITDDEVLIRVHAAGVDPGAWHLMTGLPFLVRLAGFGVRAPKNPVRGLDVSGTVEAVGANVTRFGVGDEVFGTCNGAFAEYASAREERLALKPATLNFEQAATVAISGFTALQGLRDPVEPPLALERDKISQQTFEVGRREARSIGCQVESRRKSFRQ